MITNKKLYEMISEQMNDSNHALRDQLKAQIQDKTSESQTMAQELADRQCDEIRKLSQQIQVGLGALQSDLNSEVHHVMTENSEAIVQQLTQKYDEKIDALKSELSEKLDEQLGMILYTNKGLADGINSLQQDTAVIMETLQLILTNMMLNKVETQITGRKHFTS